MVENDGSTDRWIVTWECSWGAENVADGKGIKAKAVENTMMWSIDGWRMADIDGMEEM